MAPLSGRQPFRARQIQAAELGTRGNAEPAEAALPFTLPRDTRSLCPACVKDLRARIATGEVGAEALRTSHPA